MGQIPSSAEEYFDAGMQGDPDVRPRTYRGRCYDDAFCMRARTGAGDACEYIPEPRLAPDPDDYPFIPPASKLTEIVFDLETSGFGHTAEILQLAATSGSEDFNAYLLPTRPIPRAAQRVNHLTYYNGVLRHFGRPVSAVYPNTGLKRFVDFICSYHNPILLGHNIKNFDCPVLFNTLERYPRLFRRLNNHVVGYLDTLVMFREERPGLNSYRQVDLVEYFTGETYPAHDALEDALSLQKLMQSQAFRRRDKERYIFTPDFMLESMDYQRQTKENLATFEMLIPHVISKFIAKKMAASGLQYHHLVLVIKQNGMEGLKSLLSERNDLGEVRVTRNPKIINKIFRYCYEDSSDESYFSDDDY